MISSPVVLTVLRQTWMDAHDHEILSQICAYEDYLENPKKYGRIKNLEELSEAQRERHHE